MRSELEQERFMRLWTSAEPAVRGYIYSLVRDRTFAFDVLQDVALTLFRQFGEYDESRPFVSWAMGIAHYQVLSFWRDKGRCRMTFDSDVLEKFTESWVEVSRRNADREPFLAECVRELQGRAKQIVQLRYSDNLSCDEIAKRMNVSPESIRVTLHRVRQHLRECVEKRLASQE